MESRVVKLKSDFNNIITIRNNVKNVFDILQIRIDRLSQFYYEFIQNNRNEMFVFGLDSFHFQSKLIDIEYDDMKRLFLAINNRMYCEYFKLHKIIVEYISKNVNDKKISDVVKINNYPVYKDLEPFKEYKFEIILDIHENILNLLGILISILNNKENELSIHKTKQNIGLNIDNFITSFNFNISVMREKIIMFITYIEFFHKMHSKYLKRFSNKIQLMYTHISNDIQFDDSVEISKNKKKELIDDFNSNNIDGQLLKELKTSIGSETNSEVSTDTSKSSENTPKYKIDSPSLLSPNNLINSSLSPIDISTRPKSNSFININMTPRERNIVKKDYKKDYKKFFKENVHKVTDMLQLCKPKKHQVIDQKFSDVEINRMFSGIEESCDSIIFETKNNSLETDNIGLHIDSFDNLDDHKEEIRENIPEIINTFEEIPYVLSEEKLSDMKDEVIEEEIKNEKVENKEENIDEIESEEKIQEQLIDNVIKNEELQEESIDNVIKNEEIILQQNESLDLAKKKRTYNRKKK